MDSDYLLVIFRPILDRLSEDKRKKFRNFLIGDESYLSRQIYFNPAVWLLLIAGVIIFVSIIGFCRVCLWLFGI